MANPYVGQVPQGPFGGPSPPAPFGGPSYSTTGPFGPPTSGGNPYVTGPTSEARSGAAHFGATPPPVSGPSSEARSGPGHFDSAPGAVPGSGPAPTSGLLSGPGYGEDWYKQHGQDLAGPSRSTTLFNEGAAGSNPFYDNAQKMVDQSINDQASVRGGWNSSSTMNTLGIANADLRGQQAHELGQLAGQADTADTSRYGASSAAANAAQNQTTGRATDVANGYLGLSKDQSSLVQGFYDMAAKGLETTDMAAIEAQMKAAGMDAQEIASVTNDLLRVAGIGATAASGGGKP